MNDNTEEYCRECQHPHVNERLRKEVAELRKENERWREGFEGLTREIKKMQEDHSTTREGWKMHYDSQAETIKRLKEALEHLLTNFKKTNVFHQNQGYINFIESAIPGTKETE